MINTVLHSFSHNQIEDVPFDLPEMRADQIKIETKLCGICRSDIGSYARWELMPYASKSNPDGIVGTFGHEGLGIVVEVGSKLINKVKVGDIVATYSDPAYARYYYASEHEFTIVPEINPKYILQPVASAINIAAKTMREVYSINHKWGSEILLIGTGFMSIIIGQYFKYYEVPYTVVGSSNLNLWKSLLDKEPINIDTLLQSGKKFNAVIDLSSKSENWNKITKLTNTEGVICYASTPTTPVITNFFDNCWECHKIIMPSPRNSDFSVYMKEACDLIKIGELDPTFIWTKGYDRNDIDDVKNGFEDGKNRSSIYVRGYLQF